MDSGEIKLPGYAKPPLVEVAMSVQHDPPKGLTTAHLGSFWSSLKDEYPTVKTTQPIGPSGDDFAAEGQWIPPALKFAFTDDPGCRFQMLTADQQWMWQLQSDRIVVNWRKRTEDYPRFDATLTQFKKAWSLLCEFLAGHELKPPIARLWELTYVNRVPRSSDGLWESPSDWPRVFPGLWGNDIVAVADATLRGMHGQWVWDTIDPKARLHIQARPSRSADKPPEDLLMLNLTARGPIVSGAESKESSLTEGSNTTHGLKPIQNGLNFGHRLIVFTFDQISSEKAKVEWKRHDDT